MKTTIKSDLPQSSGLRGSLPVAWGAAVPPSPPKEGPMKERPFCTMASEDDRISCTPLTRGWITGTWEWSLPTSEQPHGTVAEREDFFRIC